MSKPIRPAGLAPALAALLLGAAAPAPAQDRELPPALVDALTKVARDTLPQARFADGSTVPAETTEERARPLVPRAIETGIINRAILSAQLQLCGQDYQAISYLPYMARLRAAGDYAPKQLAYLGILHGLSLGTFVRVPEGQAPDCSEAMLNALRQRAEAQ